MTGFVSSRAPEILIVDDEKETCEEVAEFLDAHGLPCRFALSVDEALAAVAVHGDLRVVLTDLRMPHRSGFDLLQAPSVQTGVHRVIVMTGHADEAGRERALKSGAWAFIAKPLDPHVLLEAVRAALADPDAPASHGDGRRDDGGATP